MSSEPHIDPRGQSLPPTQEEIDAWALREHRRRTAWLAGPSEDEKQDWARHYRWRATLGLEESRLGPAPEDIEQWAEREHKRRTAWLAGPTEAERHRWAADQQQARRSTASPAPTTTEEEIEAWAAKERQRRQAWVAGPSEEEKQQWAERQTQGLLGGLLDSAPNLLQTELPETAQRALRDAELLGKGVLYALSRAPSGLWSYLHRAGRAFEEEFYREPRRRRVRY